MGRNFKNKLRRSIPMMRRRKKPMSTESMISPK
jgi:hypothetical protein